MTITIHGTAKSRAVRNLWLAEEMGADFVHDPVDFRDGGTKTAAFRRLGGMGQVPALSDGDVVLTESLAINLYLAKKVGGPMAPRDLAEDGQMTMWTLFGATQIEPLGITIINNTTGRPEAEHDLKALHEAEAKLARPLNYLDAALAKSGGFLVGDRFTVADVNVGMCVFYLRTKPGLVDAHAHVSRWWNGLKARPAYQKVMALRGE